MITEQDAPLDPDEPDPPYVDNTPAEPDEAEPFQPRTDVVEDPEAEVAAGTEPTDG